MPLQLRRTKQCQHCPWRKDTCPHEIPNGYSRDLHLALQSTIANSGEISNTLKIMACHESMIGDETPCIGWLFNQLGPGNNIPLRLAARNCDRLMDIELVGEQHEIFQDTLPDYRMLNDK